MEQKKVARDTSRAIGATNLKAEKCRNIVELLEKLWSKEQSQRADRDGRQSRSSYMHVDPQHKSLPYPGAPGCPARNDVGREAIPSPRHVCCQALSITVLAQPADPLPRMAYHV